MDGYVDAVDLIYNLTHWYDKKGFSHDVRQESFTIDEIQDAIKRTRRTGKWKNSTPWTDTLECSECGWNIISEEFITPYCPNCGAKLEEQQNV